MWYMVLALLALLIGCTGTFPSVYVGDQTNQLYLRTHDQTYRGLDDGHLYQRMGRYSPWLQDLTTGDFHYTYGHFVEESPSRDLQTQAITRQHDLESQSQEPRQNAATVSKLQAGLAEKTTRLEEQQRQVERLLQQLASQLQTRVDVRSQSVGSLTEAYSPREKKFNEQERKLEAVRQRALQRVNEEKESLWGKCQFLVNGMTKDEVRSIMGRPNVARDAPIDREREKVWRYGTRDPVVVEFDRQGLVRDIRSCAKPGSIADLQTQRRSSE